MSQVDRFALRVAGFRLENLGPFRDSGWADLPEGISFVVGENNSGKSWALKGLSAREPAPHIAASGEHSSGHPTLTLRYTAPAERALTMLSEGGGIWIPHAHSLAPADAAAAFRHQLTASNVFSLERKYLEGNAGSYYCPNPPYEGEPQWVYYHPGGNASPGNTVAMAVLNNESDLERQRIALFDPRRTDFSQCQNSGSRDIGGAGEWLATALAQRQANPPAYAEYLRLVRRIIPDLIWISAETSGTQASLYSWLEAPGVNSAERKLPLSVCGAGVGHVLALLYIAFYEKNRTLLIDEPQAHLHPRACRELVRVFRDLDGHGHRFVIATHSTPMLAEAMPASVIKVSRRDGESLLEATSTATVRAALSILPLVGARWSDVFGPDRLVWVEGETEAACFPLLLQHARAYGSVTFVPLHATGDIVGKKSEKAKLAYSVYSKVSTNLSLTARHCRIIIDRENLTEDEVTSLSGRFPSRVLCVTEYSMYEDLLLDADVVASRVSALLAGCGSMVDPGSIREHISNTLCNEAISCGERLRCAYASASDGRLEYRKVEEGFELTKEILRRRPQRLQAVAEWLVSVLSTDA